MPHQNFVTPPCCFVGLGAWKVWWRLDEDSCFSRIHLVGLFNMCMQDLQQMCIYIYVCVRVKKIYTIVYTQWCVYYKIYVRMEGLPIALIYNSKDPTSPLSTYLDLKRTSSHAEMRSRHFCAFQALGPLGRVILDDGHFGQKAMSGQWLLVAAKLPEKSLVHSWASPSRNKLPWTSTISDTRNLPTNSSKLRPWRTVGGGDTGK